MGTQLFPLFFFFPFISYLNCGVWCCSNKLVFPPLLLKAGHPIVAIPWVTGAYAQQPRLIYPLVMTNIAIEHGHWNSGFNHWKWWFSIVMLVYQRVYNTSFRAILADSQITKKTHPLGHIHSQRLIASRRHFPGRCATLPHRRRTFFQGAHRTEMAKAKVFFAKPPSAPNDLCQHRELPLESVLFSQPPPVKLLVKHPPGVPLGYLVPGAPGRCWRSSSHQLQLLGYKVIFGTWCLDH